MKWFTVSTLGDHMSMTPEGFLLIQNVPIARCGTQLYRHNEVPQLEADDAGWLRIDREPQEVFHRDTLASYEGKPLVDDHPDEPVGPHNWRDLAIGHIANVRRGTNADHDLLFADVLVTTEQGIRLIQRGKRAVSVGYDATYEPLGRGKGRQTRIIANHLALVDEGRCGSRCTILDGAARFLDSEAGPAGIPDTAGIKTAPAPPVRPHVALHGDLTLEYRADPDGTPLYQPRRDPASGSGWHDDIDYPQTLDLEFVEAEHPRDDGGKFSKGAAAQQTQPGKPPEPGAAVSTKNWKKVGGQLGSNPGAQMTSETGQKHYVKFAKSEAHARNEHLAAKLYEAAGAPVLKTKLVDTGGGKIGTATEWAERRDIDIADPDDRRQAQQHFATHAWLANWDAAGLTHDNQAEVDDKMTTLDPGGSLIFRAQGTPKGEAFGHEATEWDTLHHPVKGQFANQQAHELFGEMSPAQLKASAQKVAAVKASTIHDLVKAHGPGTPAQRQALAEKLVNRRNSIAKRAGLQTADRKRTWRDYVTIRPWARVITVSIRGRDDAQGWQGQPRVAAGQEGGGQWTAGGGGGAGPALPEMKSKYFQKEAGKFGEAVQAAYASGGKAAALQTAQGLVGKWKHSVMQAHMAKAIKAIQEHPEEEAPAPHAPTEHEMEAMAAAHQAEPEPEPAAAAGTLGEPKAGSQKSVHNIFNNQSLSTAEKIAKIQDKLDNYFEPANKAYAEQALALLQGGQAAPPPPDTPAQPEAAPGDIPKPQVGNTAQNWMHHYAQQKDVEGIKAEIALANPEDKAYGEKLLAQMQGKQAAPEAAPAAPEPATVELPEPEAGNNAQEWLHTLASGTDQPISEMIANVTFESKSMIGPSAKNYAEKLLQVLHGKAAMKAPDGLPPITPDNVVHEAIHATASAKDLTKEEKLHALGEELGTLSSPHNKAYVKATMTAVHGGAGTDEPAFSAPAPAPEPDFPKPDANSFRQKMAHSLATGSQPNEYKLQNLQAIANHPNTSGVDKAYVESLMVKLGAASQPEPAAPATPATPATPAAPEIPKPTPYSSVQAEMYKAALAGGIGAQKKIAQTATASNNPEAIAYANTLITHLKGGAAPAPAPPPKPPPPQGPAPYAGSPGQEKVHQIANDPNLSSAEKLQQIEAVKNDTNVSGPKTQEFANTWQEAIKQADPAGSATPATATPAAAKPAAAAKSKAAPATPKGQYGGTVTTAPTHTARYKAAAALAAKAQKPEGTGKGGYGGDAAVAQALCPTLTKDFWANEASSAQKTAIAAYWDGEYQNINDGLRPDAQGKVGTKSIGATTQAAIDHIDDLFHHPDAVLADDCRLTRGVDLPAAQVAQMEAMLGKGLPTGYVFDGFGSTSMHSTPAFSDKTHWLIITAKKGTPALGIDTHSSPGLHENEILLRHGQACEVYQIEKTGNRTYIYMTTK